MVESPKILFEDDWILIVEKPPGLQMEPDVKGHDNLQERVGAILKAKRLPYVINRLDRWVGGLVVMAKTKPMAARLNRLFEERKVQKVYLAEVDGLIQEQKRRLKHYHKKDSTNFKALISASPVSDYTPCHLTFFLIHSLKNSSLLKIELGTGKYHQIRAQLAFIGNPILGDELYGSCNAHASGIKLWSHQLIFNHPETREEIKIESNPSWL